MRNALPSESLGNAAATTLFVCSWSWIRSHIGMKVLTRCSAPRKYITTYFGLSVGFAGSPPRLMYQDSHGMFEQISGVPSDSAWLATALTVSGVDDASSMIHAVTQDGRPGQVAGPGRAGLGVVGLDGDRIGLAADLEPVLVRGGLLNLGDHPVVRRAEPGQGTGQRVDPADRDGLGAARPGPGPDDDPLMLELHASSRPPAPTANAPAPNALSTLRRPMPGAAAGGPAAARAGPAESGDGLSDGLVMAFPLTRGADEWRDISERPGARSRIRRYEVRLHVQLIVQRIVNNLRDKRVFTLASLRCTLSGRISRVRSRPAVRHIPALRAVRGR